MRLQIRFQRVPVLVQLGGIGGNRLFHPQPLKIVVAQRVQSNLRHGIARRHYQVRGQPSEVNPRHSRAVVRRGVV